MQNKIGTWLLIAFSGMIILFFVSCKKEKQPDHSIPTVPDTELEYFDLNNTIIRANASGFAIDVNNDGRNDLAFTTLLIGDPVNQVDRLQFLVSSNIQINLPVNIHEQIPVLNIGDLIVLDDFNGYQWFELSSIVLVQKIISFTQPSVWEGNWLSAVHKYLPYQVINNGRRYNGWVEITIDIVNERIILYKAVISKEADKVVKAGN